MPITIPKHEPIKKVYVEMVRQIVESEVENDEEAESLYDNAQITGRTFSERRNQHESILCVPSF